VSENSPADFVAVVALNLLDSTPTPPASGPLPNFCSISSRHGSSSRRSCASMLSVSTCLGTSARTFSGTSGVRS
jgi:hypothetical protein